MRELPPAMRELLGDRVRGLGYEEIAASRGRSYANVNRSLARARERLAEVRAARDSDERGLPRSPPPFARHLDELERRPPAYLRAALGRPPPAGVKHGHSARLAWRRAAARIERYRHERGITDPSRALGEPPADAEAQGARDGRGQHRACADADPGPRAGADVVTGVNLDALAARRLRWHA